MDYDFDSSDFHFPSDTGLPKLSSPLSFKVPESRDWALEEFIHTLQDKPCTDLENLLSFKQYIPVNDDEDEDETSIDFSYAPLKLNLPLYEEKEVLQKLSQHILNLEQMELHDILKGGFTLVQNDIQSNNTPHHYHQQKNTKAPGLSWFNEAIDFGRPTIDNLDTVQEEKKEFRLFADATTRHANNINATTVSLPSCSEQPVTTVVQPEKPLPSLPKVAEVKEKKKKGLKSKLKSSAFFSSTKKFIRKILPVSS